MPPSKRAKVHEAAPLVQEAIGTLRSSGSDQQADAVQTVLDIALETAGQSVQFASGGQPNMAIPIDFELHNRAYARSTNLTADVLEGWQRFLDGKWTPKQPTRAAHGKGKAKSVLNVRAPKAFVDQVDAAADRLIAEKGWPVTRGYKLNARHIAVQWIARKYPAPRKSEAAAE
jgi:hypothetical protein